MDTSEENLCEATTIFHYFFFPFLRFFLKKDPWKVAIRLTNNRRRSNDHGRRWNESIIIWFPLLRESERFPSRPRSCSTKRGERKQGCGVAEWAAKWQWRCQLFSWLLSHLLFRETIMIVVGDRHYVRRRPADLELRGFCERGAVTTPKMRNERAQTASPRRPLWRSWTQRHGKRHVCALVFNLQPPLCLFSDKQTSLQAIQIQRSTN